MATADRSGSAALDLVLGSLLASPAVRTRLAAVLGWGRAPTTTSELRKMSESPDLVQRGVAFQTVRLLQEWKMLPASAAPERSPADGR